METKSTITFHYSKNCIGPRSVDSSCNLFCLYALEEITIPENELKTLELQTKFILPPNISVQIIEKTGFIYKIMTSLTLADG